jgi:hypothetical protein
MNRPSPPSQLPLPCGTAKPTISDADFRRRVEQAIKDFFEKQRGRRRDRRGV